MEKLRPIIVLFWQIFSTLPDDSSMADLLSLSLPEEILANLRELDIELQEGGSIFFVDRDSLVNSFCQVSAKFVFYI